MQAFIDHLTTIAALPVAAARRALGPHFSVYVDRIDDLKTSLSNWETDRNNPVVGVPASINEHRIKFYWGAPERSGDLGAHLDVSNPLEPEPAKMRLAELFEIENRASKVLRAQLVDDEVRLDTLFEKCQQSIGMITEPVVAPAPTNSHIDRRRVGRFIDALNNRMVDLQRRNVSSIADVADLLESSNGTDSNIRKSIIERFGTTSINISDAVEIATEMQRGVDAVQASPANRHPINRKCIQEKLRGELERVNRTLAYTVRHARLIDAAGMTGTVKPVDAFINTVALTHLQQALTSALDVLKPVCCNCAKECKAAEVSNHDSQHGEYASANIRDMRACGLHVYCADCHQALVQGQGCPLCYHEQLYDIRRIRKQRAEAEAAEFKRKYPALAVAATPIDPAIMSRRRAEAEAAKFVEDADTLELQL
jgi:hypothetical protein